MLENKTIHLCVTGGIAAYKAVELARALVKAGAAVRVAMSEGAQHFVGPLTFQAVTQNPVLTTTLDPSEEMEIGHIAFAQECDALVVAPATANILGKAAGGIGDELISTVLLAANVPVVMAPAMNTFMYENPIVQGNIECLMMREWRILEPDVGELACGHVGPGRLPETQTIVEAVGGLFSEPLLQGRHVVIAAGPTREYFDPVRYLSNPSSGKSGFALASAAMAAGAEVTLIHGPVDLEPPMGVYPVSVTSADQMQSAIQEHVAGADAVVMTAAVADWKPAQVAETKMKKGDDALNIQLVRTPDILAQLGRARTGDRPVLVGYAAETGDPRENARGKLEAKAVDLVVANDVTQPGAGFGTDTNQAWLVTADGDESLPMMSKAKLAEKIIHWIAEALGEHP